MANHLATETSPYLLQHAGNPADERLRALARAVGVRYLPSLVLAGGMGAATDGITLFQGRAGEVPVAYVCRAYACDAPTSDPAVLAAQLDALRGGVVA